ncbi:MAG: fatty acid--CoA ligase family protein [Pseudomonadota bacterium]
MSEFLFERLSEAGKSPAVILGNSQVSHRELLDLVVVFRDALSGQMPAGSVVSFDGDYSAQSVGLFLALLDLQMIIVPLSSDSSAHFDEFREIAEVEYLIQIDGQTPRITKTDRTASSELYRQLRAAEAPGLVLFSSGSTGKSKAIVQDLSRLLQKFLKRGKPQRMLIFLQLDHIGGINSLLYTLANGGCLVTPSSRAPTEVARAIENHDVELLPTSPTFLNLLLLSGALEQHDLSTLRLITYGTEPMQATTLERLREALPEVRLQQTYGLSEVGILRSRSKSSDSLWMQIGGAEFDLKIHGGTLWIRSDSAMLGYLNAPAPFDEEGYFDTGDMVEQDGEWIRILGRVSEIINVGGQKVYPAEVETVLLEMPEVADAVVYKIDNPITGASVAARVRTNEDLSTRELKARLLLYCKDRMPSYKMPTRISISDEELFNERFKRMRKPKSATER